MVVCASEISIWLFECPGGFLFYERDAGQLHFFNDSGLLVWNLLSEETEAESVAWCLARSYGLPQPPVEEVQSIAAVLSKRRLIAVKAESSCRNNAAELDQEGLWTQSRKAAERALAGGAWEIPSILSFPFDGLRVSSAKCSSRWVNLDDNTCYVPALVDP
jgi:hypothetical protein